MNFKLVIKSPMFLFIKGNYRGLHMLNTVRELKEEYKSLKNTQINIDRSYLDKKEVILHLTEDQAIKTGFFSAAEIIHINVPNRFMENFIGVIVKESKTSSKKIAMLRVTFTVDTDKFFNKWKELDYNTNFKGTQCKT